MLYPKDGTYNQNEKDGRVILQVSETPSSSIFQRVVAITNTFVMVGGMALSVAGVVTFFCPALVTVTVETVMATGSYFLAGYSIAGYRDIYVLIKFYFKFISFNPSLGQVSA